MTNSSPGASPPKKREFKPAKPSQWLIKAAQTLVKTELALKYRLHISDDDLDILKGLPPGAGVVLIPNHADETDPRICLELSRRTGRRFFSMCNREAFDEIYGLAGWALQRLGHFSVERGAHDTDAKEFAIETVQKGEEVLVIFPEGEIFYLNEVVQAFHSGAVEICMQAIVDKRKRDANFTAFLVPMAIKYHYTVPIENLLLTRIEKMEARLSIKEYAPTLSGRLQRIQKTLLEREQAAYKIQIETTGQKDLYEEIVETENAIISQIEEKHQGLPVSQSHLIDQSWQLSAELKEDLAVQTDIAVQKELKQDIDALKEVAQLSSWRPQYYGDDTSMDRLAEGLMKMERELYRIKRPAPLTTRDVYVKLAEPIDLSAVISDYLADARVVRHNLTQDLHEKIQALVDQLIQQANARAKRGQSGKR
jgi:1-acyl-sn-glycerol-3-phosphate acyltransferase